jgi:hypothetical protein
VKIDDVIRNLEPHTPLDIRVMCPSGHFIANMTLSVRNGDLAIQGAHSKYDLQRKAVFAHTSRVNCVGIQQLSRDARPPSGGDVSLTRVTERDT